MLLWWRKQYEQGGGWGVGGKLTQLTMLWQKLKHVYNRKGSRQINMRGTCFYSDLFLQIISSKDVFVLYQFCNNNNNKNDTFYLYSAFPGEAISKHFTLAFMHASIHHNNNSKNIDWNMLKQEYIFHIKYKKQHSTFKKIVCAKYI